MAKNPSSTSDDASAPPPGDLGAAGMGPQDMAAEGVGGLLGAMGVADAPNAPYVVLARKYRPRNFTDLIGQEAMVTTLTNAFASDRIAQGYMLTGVRGVGKTTTARILARALNFAREGEPDRPRIDLPTDPAAYGRHCREILESRHPDVMEMDAASNTGIDNIREIIESARYRPLVARYKVFIIDEVHMLSKGAFNALLKTLEEPPPHVKFIFATTEVRRVPVTVLSRCQRFDLRRVDVPELSSHFARIVAAEGATAEPEALALIARAAEGSVRDGLSILDQGIAMGSGSVSFDSVRAMLGLADRGRIFDLLELVLSGKAGPALDALTSLHRDGADPMQILADLAEVVHTTTRARTLGAENAGEALSAEERRRAGALAGKLSIPLLSRAWQMLVKGLEEAGKAPDPLAAADMVLIRLAHTADLPTPDELIKAMGGEPRRTGAATTANGAGNGHANPPQASAEAGVDARSGSGEAVIAAATSGATPPRAASSHAEAGQAVGPDPASADDGSPAGPEAGPERFEVERMAGYDLADEFIDDGDDEAFEDQDESGLAAPEAPPDPRSFEEVVALVGARRDARLKVHLEVHASLVRFDGEAGSIDLHLMPGAPPEIANELREKLNRWTGRRWVIMLSKAMGDRPLAVVRAEREAAELESLKAHPAIKAVLDVFPEASITSVKPVLPAADTDEAHAQGRSDDDPVEDTGTG